MGLLTRGTVGPARSRRPPPAAPVQPAESRGVRSPEADTLPGKSAGRGQTYSDSEVRGPPQASLRQCPVRCANAADTALECGYFVSWGFHLGGLFDCAPATSATPTAGAAGCGWPQGRPFKRRPADVGQSGSSFASSERFTGLRLPRGFATLTHPLRLRPGRRCNLGRIGLSLIL